MIRNVGVDPSTLTGFVASENGIITRQKELTVGLDPKHPMDMRRFTHLIDEIIQHFKPDDFICIESPAYNAKGRSQDLMYGIHYSLRMFMYIKQIPYVDVTPSQLKMWVGKGNAPKKEVMKNVEALYGFKHRSDNVVDAFVLAKISEALNDDSVPLTGNQEKVIKKLKPKVRC